MPARNQQSLTPFFHHWLPTAFKPHPSFLLCTQVIRKPWCSCLCGSRDRDHASSCPCVWMLTLTYPLASIKLKKKRVHAPFLPLMGYFMPAWEACLPLPGDLSYGSCNPFRTLVAKCGVIICLPMLRGWALMLLYTMGELRHDRRRVGTL